MRTDDESLYLSRRVKLTAVHFLFVLPVWLNISPDETTWTPFVWETMDRNNTQSLLGARTWIQATILLSTPRYRSSLFPSAKEYRQGPAKTSPILREWTAKIFPLVSLPVARVNGCLSFPVYSDTWNVFVKKSPSRLLRVSIRKFYFFFFFCFFVSDSRIPSHGWKCFSNLSLSFRDIACQYICEFFREWRTRNEENILLHVFAFVCTVRMECFGESGRQRRCFLIKGRLYSDLLQKIESIGFKSLLISNFKKLNRER